MKYIFIINLFLFSCIEAGTHGAIARYQFPVSKYVLEKAIDDVLIKNADSIYRDSIKGFYNDDSNYVTMRIVTKSTKYRYIFRFYGDKEFWDTSRQSSIFIAYAYNNNNEGGSAGSGKGINSYNSKVREDLVDLFNRMFVDKVKMEMREDVDR